MSFSENLKQIRKEHHLSQEELAELLDVSRQAVSKWEQGQGYLRTITLVFHVGTEKEKVETVEVPKGLALWLVLPEDVTESFSVYADAACTVPHESNGDYTSDVTVYIK